MTVSEHDIQKAYFNWLKYERKDIYECAFAVPNGGHRHIAVASKLKAEGVKPGVPDIFIAWPQGKYCGLFLEVKTEKGNTTKLQKSWIQLLGQKGFKAVVCKGLQSLMDATNLYFENEK